VTKTIRVVREKGITDVPWDEFKRRTGPLVDFLEALDMRVVEIRIGKMMSKSYAQGVVPYIEPREAEGKIRGR